MTLSHLQTAFALSSEDKHLGVSKNIVDIFAEATKNEPV